MSTEKPARAPRYITPEGFRRIAAEHERIWTVLRPRIVAEDEAAAASTSATTRGRDTVQMRWCSAEMRWKPSGVM